MNGTQVFLAGKNVKTRITGLGYDAEVLIDSTNQRIKIINFQGSRFVSLTEKLIVLATERNLGKIIFFSSEAYRNQAESAGFILEGEISGFFNGKTAACYSFYTDGKRSKSTHIAQEDKIIQEVTGDKGPGKSENALPNGYQLREVQEAEVDRLVGLYRQVFASYPSPMFEPDYVRQVMKENSYFIAVYQGHELISAGSAEMDFKNSNAEITDLATNKKARGLGLATTIIAALEKEMWQRKFKALYSLARAGVPSVNRGFYKLGYHYRGRLINNCHIGGRFEDMNLWVKLKR